MSFYNKTKNPFPFYELEGDVWTNYKPLWFKNRCNYTYQNHNVYYGERYFQLQLKQGINSFTDISDVNLRNVSDNTIVSQTFTKNLITDSQGNKFLILKADFSSGLVENYYYISVTTTLGKYYSETFCILNPSTKSITIEWASNCSKVGQMVYKNSFKHSINLDAVIIPLEPEIEENLEEDGLGNETPTLQILKQGFTFSLMLPNFLAQALSAIQLHNQFAVANTKLGESIDGFEDNITSFEAKITPEEDGCFSFCEVTYIKETITKTGCCDDIYEIDEQLLSAVWTISLDADDRTCEFQDGQFCNQSILLTESISDAISYISQIKYDDGPWNDQSNITSLQPIVMQVDEGYDNYYFRFKVIRIDNIIQYSNQLKLTIIN